MADIAQAFIRLRPDGTGFGEETSATVKKTTAGVKATIPLAVDDKAASAALDRMRERLAALSGKVYNAGLNVKDNGAELKLARIALTLGKLNDTTANPDIKVDGVAKAEVQLLALEHQFAKLNNSTGRVRASTVRLQNALQDATPAWAGMIAAGLALGPSLIPVLTVVSGLTVGIGAAAVAGGAAFGLFAAVAKAHLTAMKKELLKVQAANKAANLALLTPAGQRTQSQQQAIANAKAMTAAFQKDYGQLADAQEKLSNAWKRFSNQRAVNDTLAKLFGLLTTALPKLNPLLRLGANAVQVFVAALSGWVQSGGLDRLVKGLASLGSNVAIPGFIKILHNLATTFGALAPAAGKFASGAVGALVKLTGALAAWAQSKGSGVMDRFLALVRKDGPKVAHTLGALAAAVPNLVRGLNPLAPVSLAIATALAGIIAAAPPHLITGLAVAFIALYGAVKVVSAATTIYNGVAALLELRTKAATVASKLQIFWSKAAAVASKAWAAAQWLLNAALDANPIGIIVLLIGGLVLAIIETYKHSATFRKVVQQSFHLALVVIQFVWTWVKAHWPLLLAILLGPIGALAAFVIKNFSKIKSVVQGVWKDIQLAFLKALDIMLTGLGRLVGFMAKLPGPLGAPFKAASKAIQAQIGHIHDLERSLQQVHSKTVSLKVDASGNYTVQAIASQGHHGGDQRTLAFGGLITQGSGPTADDVVARVSRGEYVVKAAAVRKYGPRMMDAVNSMRFAQGGIVGGYHGNATGLGKFDVREYNATTRTLERAVATAAERAMAQGFGASNAITKYAQSFIGRVPYVWGGSTPAGWDCSGFSSWVYHHFGFPAPRTSQTQWQWVQRTAQPIAGGLAFFAGADGTVTSPGHVGIILGPNKMVDAYGTGFGTRINSIYGSSGAVAGFGVPPGRGFRHLRYGGLIDEPVMGIGLRTGRGWSLGEAGVERVTPGQGLAGPSAEQLLARMCQLLEDAPYRTGGALGQVLNGVAGRSARSAYYETR